MRIAYLILAHKDPIFIERLTNRLVQETDNHCFIHVDAKTKAFDGIMNESPNIHWITNRIPVYWGGYNIIEATLSLLNKAAQANFDRYMILQGADYPLFSNTYIDRFFHDNSDVEFINAVDETVGSRREWYRYIPKNYLDKPNVIKRLKNRLNADYWRSNLPKPRIDCTIEFDGLKHHIFRGWAHFALTHESVKYVLEFSRNHSDYNDRFRHVYAPDESYFHTIIYNSKFVDNTPNKGAILKKDRSLENLLNLTYCEYPSAVREFKSKDDYEYLKHTDYLFFRKASSESKDLLDWIDEHGE